MVEEDVVQKILKLANELEDQQKINQEAAAGIKLHLSDIKQRAESKEQEIAGKLSAEQIHERTQAYLAAADETVPSLATKYVSLLMEHEAVLSRKKQLESECNNLQTLVKDYESGLSAIAAKIRAHTHQNTKGHVQLQQEYDALLDAEKRTTAALFVENTMLQTQLRRLTSKLRDVYKGDTKDDNDSQLYQLTIENRGLREMLQIAQGTFPPESAPSSDPNLSTKYESHLPSSTLDIATDQSGVLGQYFANNST